MTRELSYIAGQGKTVVEGCEEIRLGPRFGGSPQQAGLGKALILISLLCTTFFSGPVVAWYPSLRSLSAKRLEVVKTLGDGCRRAGAGNAWRRALETSTPSARAESRANVLANVCLRKNLPDAENPTISGFWTLMEWMRMAKSVCTSQTRTSEKGKNGDGIQRAAADLPYH
ncbi:hypothetical protein V8E52_010129 [Russula decolorans]